ncbi:MAG: hypothetical protein WCO94_04040 [Verrucomicrobiota bacterium]
MKLRGNPLTTAPIRVDKAAALVSLGCRFSICGLLAACSPSPDTTPKPQPTQQPARATPASVVSIPEEFMSPASPPRPKPSVLPRVVFATSDFQVTTEHGIQGIRAGEALNFIREEEGDYIVQYRAIQFKKNKTYFASTYVEPARQDPNPLAGEPTPVATRVSPEPPLPSEPPLSGTVPANDPELVAGQKKVGNLTASIRALNEQIRSAQNELDRKSARSSGGDAESVLNIKKSVRAIQNLKEKRDELSAQLTEMGKP